MTRRCSTYTVLNLCFVAIIFAVFIYSLLFVDNHPIPSTFTQLTGIEPVSCGLSRAFSQLVRGNLMQALALNPHSVRVFAFFVGQLLMRTAAIVLTHFGRLPRKVLIVSDISISVGLFLFCFAPLIRYTIGVWAMIWR